MKRFPLSVVVPLSILTVALIIGGGFVLLNARDASTDLRDVAQVPLPTAGRICFQGSATTEVHAVADIAEGAARLAVMWDRSVDEVLLSRGELVETDVVNVFELDGPVISPSAPDSEIAAGFSLSAGRLDLPDDRAIGTIRCDQITNEVATLETVADGLLPLG